MLAVYTRYLPATRTKGARIRAYSANGDYVIVPFEGDGLGNGILEAHKKALKVFCHYYVGEFTPSDVRYGDSFDGRGFVFVFNAARID